MSKEDKSKVIIDDLELAKALEDLGINLTQEDIKKSDYSEKEDDDDEEEGKKKEPKKEDEADEESMKKSIELAEKEYFDIQKSLEAKQSEIDNLKSKLNPDKKSEEFKKSEISSIDIIKGLINDFNGKVSDISEIQKSQTVINENIVKSLESLTEKVQSISENIETIGSNSQGKRSVDKFSILEKANGIKDENDKFILSVSKDKEKVLGLIEKAYDEESDSIKKSHYEDSILNFNAGGVLPAKEVVVELYNKHNVRLVN